MTGSELYNLVVKLFSLNRSLTGEGVRKTFEILAEYIDISVYSVNSGEEFYDWVVPPEWHIDSAFLKDEKGNVLINFSDNNLHVMGYSIPFKGWVTREKLFNHLFYLDDLPDAIPYVTSYYKENWGFCIKKNELINFTGNNFYVEINSKLFNGVLNYADYILKGELDEEIVFSTYICHPSMVSNELSGPVVAIGLIKYLESISYRKYTYRFIFVPETIGAIIYINRNYLELKTKVKAGYVLTCLGDDNHYSIVKSPYSKSYSDKVGLAVLNSKKNKKVYSFLDRGSDERQYCSPNVNLPFSTLCRTKFYEYKEYHTSLDNLDYTSPVALENSLAYVRDIVQLIEKNKIYKIKSFCEPQLGKRGLYPSTSTRETNQYVKNLMDVIAYLDGTNDLIDLVNLLNIDLNQLLEIIDKLLINNLIIECE